MERVGAQEGKEKRIMTYEDLLAQEMERLAQLEYDRSCAAHAYDADYDPAGDAEMNAREAVARELANRGITRAYSLYSELNGFRIEWDCS